MVGKLKSNRRIVIVLALQLLLLVPFVAMQYTNGVNWSVFDFLIASVLLGGLGVVVVLILSKAKSKATRIAFLICLILAFLLVWAELAVGIFT